MFFLEIFNPVVCNWVFISVSEILILFYLCISTYLWLHGVVINMLARPLVQDWEETQTQAESHGVIS